MMHSGCIQYIILLREQSFEFMKGSNPNVSDIEFVRNYHVQLQAVAFHLEYCMKGRKSSNNWVCLLMDD